MADPERILLVRLSHLGDLVHALPCFHLLRERFESAAIAWVVQPEFAGLLAGLEGLDRVVPFDRRGGLRAWPRVVRELRAFAPDLSVDVQGNWKSAAIARASGARRRVAPAKMDWREPSAAFLANELAPPAPAEARHAQDRVLHVARFTCGERVGLDEGVPRRDPVLTRDELEAGRARLFACGAFARERPVLVQVSPADDVRTATDACLVDAAAELAAAGRGVVLVAAAAETERARRLAESIERRTGNAPARVTDSPDLRVFTALLSAAAEARGTLVTGDTGPLHLAAAVGLRCVCLSGPYDWRATGPWPSPRAAQMLAPSGGTTNGGTTIGGSTIGGSTIGRAADARSVEPDPGPARSSRGESATPTLPPPHRVLTVDLDCRPCNARVCRRSGGRACLDDLDGAAVARAVLDERA